MFKMALADCSGVGDAVIAQDSSLVEGQFATTPRWRLSHFAGARHFGATPAERITLSTPAAKPSRRNTVSPHGEIPSQRSMSQPRPAPTITPATNSLESRKPLA